jgi:Secretion system C-terminal sorting domain
MKPILLLLILISNLVVSAQISIGSLSRGSNPGELYFATPWFYSETLKKEIIIKTINSGKDFMPIYKYIMDSDEMPIGIIHSDKENDCLYNIVNSELYFSNDDGLSWVRNHNKFFPGYYTTGNTEGEIYVVWSNQAEMRVELHRSVDFGVSFILQNDSIGYIGEVGTEEGEIYLHYFPDNHSNKIEYSNDYGKSFYLKTFIPYNIVGNDISNYYPAISRGTSPGEVYYISWHNPSCFKIYRSNDYGMNFALQYEQRDTANSYSEVYFFTSGRGVGEFYVVKSMPWYNGINTKLHVYYSSDYAKTFTEYIHVLGKNWTGIENINAAESYDRILNYPNPFSNQTTIVLPKEIDLNNTRIYIYNTQGKLVNELYSIEGRNVTFNSENNNSGIYYYKVLSENIIVGTGKMVIIK